MALRTVQVSEVKFSSNNNPYVIVTDSNKLSPRQTGQERLHTKAYWLVVDTKSGEVINPFEVGQIDTVFDIVSLKSKTPFFEGQDAGYAGLFYMNTLVYAGTEVLENPKVVPATVKLLTAEEFKAISLAHEEAVGNKLVEQAGELAGAKK